MTVIAYRNGVMAADTAVWSDGLIVGHTRKIIRLADGRLFAASGPRPLILACKAWLSGQGHIPSPVEEHMFGGLLADRACLRRVTHAFDIYDCPEAMPFAAEGCHVTFMLGAMAAGATAPEAVAMAIKFGDAAAGEVQVEQL